MYYSIYTLMCTQLKMYLYNNMCYIMHVDRTDKPWKNENYNGYAAAKVKLLYKIEIACASNTLS